MGLTILITALLLGCIQCGNRATPRQAGAARKRPGIVRTLPHDTTAFTQGLLYLNGRLYESTGLHGRSSLRVIDTVDGRIIKHRQVPRVFAEGVAYFAGRFYQLTWQDQFALVYDTARLEVIDTLRYTGEGWGLTATPRELVMSNGSATLTFRNARFEPLRTITVTRDGHALNNLNELEYARGKIYANVWFSDYIFEIDPTTGTVTAIYDCTELVRLSGAQGQEAVLNGIAYNPEKETFYLTGKNWPKMFEVKLP